MMLQLWQSFIDKTLLYRNLKTFNVLLRENDGWGGNDFVQDIFNNQIDVLFKHTVYTTNIF